MVLFVIRVVFDSKMVQLFKPVAIKIVIRSTNLSHSSKARLNAEACAWPTHPSVKPLYTIWTHTHVHCWILTKHIKDQHKPFWMDPATLVLVKKVFCIYLLFTEVTFQQNSELQIPKTSQILPHTLDKLYFKYSTMSPAFFCPQIARLRITRAACVF